MKPDLKKICKDIKNFQFKFVSFYNLPFFNIIIYNENYHVHLFSFIRIFLFFNINIFVGFYKTFNSMDTQLEKTFFKLKNNESRNPLHKTRKRNFRNIGMGVKAPSEAKEGKYVDKKCPFTGSISIRGRILRGTVISTKMKRSIIIRRDYLHWISKYKRFEKRHKNIPCHCSPCFRVQEGDLVTIGQCRPLSKTIRFNVLRVDKQVSRIQSKDWIL